MQGVWHTVFELLAIVNPLLQVEEQADIAEQDFGKSDCQDEQEEGELANIMGSHAAVDPGAVMVVAIHTPSTYIAVEHLGSELSLALCAEWRLEGPQIPRLSFSKLP